MHSLLVAVLVLAQDRVILSFEEDEIRPLVDAFKLDRKEKDDTVTIEKPFFLYPKWTLVKGRASHGEWGFGLGVARWATPEEPRNSLKSPADAVRVYGAFRDNYAAILNTCGVFRKLMPMDWSGYDSLRLDVSVVDADHTIRVQLEDEEIAPPIVRTFVVKPGAWTTLELDLRAAEKVRKLDLKRMATLSVAVVKTDRKGKGFGAWMDNVRLSSSKTPALRDDSPLDLPEYYRSSAKPVVKPPPIAPDRSPLPAQQPIVIPLDRPGVKYQGNLTDLSHVGWVSAYDNKHLLVGFRDSSDGWALQSADGGQTWTGPINVPLNVASDHGAGRGDAIGTTADVLVLSNNGCNGASRSTTRFFSHKLAFTGAGWTLQEPVLVTGDPRHCVSNQSIVRGPDGRLWLGYGEVGRLGTRQTNVQVSDDEGATWKSSREGTSGVVPGTIWSEKHGVNFTYVYEEPCLVPLGSGVACIWEEGAKGNAPTSLKWARFDGARWSAIEDVEAGPLAGPVRPRMHAVSVGGREVFVASGLRHGVFRWCDGKWSREPVDVPAGARLSVAGDRTVMAFAVKDKSAIVSWQRRADGTWTAPRELAREDQPISKGMNGYYYPGLVVMAYAPPNFVPVAWSTGQKWIKVVRVPVE